jgi:hypothetical protein
MDSFERRLLGALPWLLALLLAPSVGRAAPADEFAEWASAFNQTQAKLDPAQIAGFDFTCSWIKNGGPKGSPYRSSFVAKSGGTYELFSPNTFFWNHATLTQQGRDMVATLPNGPSSVGTYTFRKIDADRVIGRISFDGNVIYLTDCHRNVARAPRNVFAVVTLGDDGVVMFDPTGKTVAQTTINPLTVDGPHGIAYGEGVLAVANPYSNTIYFLDTLGRMVYEPVMFGGAPMSVFPEIIAYGDGVFFNTNYFDKTLSRVALPHTASGALDPFGDVTDQRIQTGGRKPAHVVFGDHKFGVVYDDAFDVITPSGTTVASVTLQPGSESAAFGDGVFAVSNGTAGTVSLITPAGVVTKAIAVEGARGVAFGDGVFLVASRTTQKATLFTADGTVTATGIDLGTTNPGDRVVYSVGFGQHVFAVAKLVRGKPQDGRVSLLGYDTDTGSIHPIAMDQLLGPDPLAVTFAR